MAVIDWFVRNGVAANLILLLIVATGAIVLTDIEREIFPEFSLEMITVTAEYRGASPGEVEGAICLRVEDALQGIDGVKKIISSATESRAIVTVEVVAGYDVRRVLGEIKTAVDAIDTFPEEVEQLVVREVTSRSQVINVAITGDTSLATLKRIGERVRDDLTALPEISQSELFNVPPSEISIEVSEEALRRWGLTLDMVANAVREFSIDLPGGSLRTAGGEVLLRTKGQAYSGEEYQRLPLLTRPDGTRIRLEDVATVTDGFQDVSVSAEFDGNPAVMVKVYRVGDQSAITVAEAVDAYVRSASTALPEGIGLFTWQDNARELKGRIDLLAGNALTGLALVFVVLALFLRLRLAFWVTLGIPVSFLGAIALMPAFDVSMNMVSLFSFILVLGIVVDDAIVVAENIYTTQVRTGKGIAGAVRGTREVLVPVTFGVLTTMAAFTPMLFVPGAWGKLIAVVPLIVLPTLFFSLVESNLVLPSHLSHFKPPRQAASPSRIARLLNGIFVVCPSAMDWFARAAYRPILRAALRWRYLTLSAALFAVMLTVGLMGAGIIRVILSPHTEPNNVVAFLTMPTDVPVGVTKAGVERLERAAAEVREQLAANGGRDPVVHVLASVGQHPFREIESGPVGDGGAGLGNFLGEVNLELLPSEVRTIRAEEFANLWRERVGQIPGAVELSIEHDLIGGGKPIDLELTGSDLGKVREVVETVKNRLAEYQGVIDITDTFRVGKPEIELVLTSEGESLGLTLQELGRQVRQGFFGEQAQRIQRDRDDVRVMVRYPAADRRSVRDLQRMRVRAPGGDEIPFSTVATGTIVRGPAAITRVDRRRAISVQAEVDERVTTGGQVIAAMEAEFLPELMARYPGITYSFGGEEAEFAESMAGLAKGFAVVMFVMYGMLAIPLKSYWKPGIILSAIPFGMVGAIWGHGILGLEVSFLSIAGLVPLTGVVVNDSLVLVAYIHRNSGRGVSLREIVQQAGEARFRAIILTSLTTAFGVTPLILEKSIQAQSLIPMAVTLASGVLFATVVTLVLVPSLFLIMDDLRKAARWFVSGATKY